MTYRMDDGTVVKTENATQSWPDARRWDGSNYISIATGSQFANETLYRSRKGRYWLEHVSAYQGTAPYAEWIGERSATQWLLANDYELPKDLKVLEAEISE